MKLWKNYLNRMNKKLVKLKEIWKLENISNQKIISKHELISFMDTQNIVIPIDMVEYFETLNGTNDDYDCNFFRFCSIFQFKSINDDLKNWKGIPDYSNLINTLPDYKSYYVFADYMFCMFSYAIKLYPNNCIDNNVIVISGDKYKIIANSFNEFMDLYLNNSIELQLNI